MALLLPALALAQPTSPGAAPHPAVPAAPAASQAAGETPVQDLQAWRQRVREAIQQHMVPPASIPLDAQVELEVSLLPSGLAADVATRRASGYPDLDAALRRAVVVATPLPLPADPQGYERLRRFSVLYEVRSGVRIVDAHPLPSEAPRKALACRAPGAAAAPSCAAGGSRTDLLTCYAQAVRTRTLDTAGACGTAAYPLEARQARLEGTVQVGINFESAGRLGAVGVARSSGHPILDQHAVELVRESILPPPSELIATPFVVQVPVVFQMQREEAADPAHAAPAPATRAAPAGDEAAPAKPAAKPKSATKKKKPVKKKKKSTAKKRRV